jgi:hypothetical protein
MRKIVEEVTAANAAYAADCGAYQKQSNGAG